MKKKKMLEFLVTMYWYILTISMGLEFIRPFGFWVCWIITFIVLLLGCFVIKRIFKIK